MNNKLFKTIPCITTALSTAIIIPSLTSCNNQDKILDQLMRLPRVSSVSKATALPSYNARYNLYFKLPLDWQDETKGEFELKVELNLRDFDAVNQFYICGYELVEIVNDRVNDYEVARHYQGNLIRTEFRYYHDSRPAGLKNTDVEGWKYLTNAQATDDFKAVIESLKTLFKGKWVATGPSKGGESVNILAMTYPSICDAYISYVAPAAFDRDDGTLNTFVYDTMGDDVFGTEEALARRKKIATFQNFIIGNIDTAINGNQDDTLVSRVWNVANKDGREYSEYLTNHHDYLFLLCAQEFATAFWQYNQKMDELEEVLAIEDINQKLIAASNLLLDINGPESYAITDLSFPYVIQAHREMGEYKYDFVQMLASFDKYGLPDVSSKISVPAEERESFHWRALFNDKQYEAWNSIAFDKTLSNNLNAWYKTCTAPVFMINGCADPWYAYALKGDTKGSGIRQYLGTNTKAVEGRSHKTRISTLPILEQYEIWLDLDSVLFGE